MKPRIVLSALAAALLALASCGPPGQLDDEPEAAYAAPEQASGIGTSPSAAPDAGAEK